MGLITVNSEVAANEAVPVQPQTVVPTITSLQQLQEQFADLFDDTADDHFPCEPYQIQLDPTVIVYT